MPRLTPLILALALLPACADTHFGPALPADLAASDNALTGLWNIHPDADAHGTFKIMEIAVPVRDGRLDPASWLVHHADEPPRFRIDPPPEFKTAYRITIRSKLDGGRESVLYGYLIDIGPERFLALHAGVGELSESIGPPFVLPTVILLKYERDGGTARVWFPRHLLMYLPQVDPGGAAQEPPPWPYPHQFLDPDQRDPRWPQSWSATTSLDTLLNYYEQHAHKPGFFVDAPMVFLREEAEAAD